MTARPYFDNIISRSDSEADYEYAAREIENDVEGRTEFNLREAIAESIKVCGRAYTREIIETEMT